MSRNPNGVRKHTGGWFNGPLMRRSSSANLVREQRLEREVVPTPEELEAKRQANDDQIAAIFAEADRKDRERRSQRGLTRIVDAEARVAVEGDTDLNHDNLEG